uniref:Uncharacterized protein n=1 Tax=Thuretia quercifolia TaxID=189650 RepID=A0A1Z1MK98_9FLOR|nr:hypothetical protein [Thuretia quercifolia]ARW66366.1 hypothetical protein [Thuretia quercifolia]
MNQYIYTFHKFHSIFILPTKKSINLRKKLLSTMIIE